MAYTIKKNSIIKEVLIAESKWNKSKLSRSGKNKTVKQMSQEWVLKTMQKLIKKNPSMPYNTLKQFIDNNQYRARLFRLKPIYDSHIQITIYKIKNKGFKSFNKVIESELKPININNPKNNFEKKILISYNRCRDKYLRKYFPMLTTKEIKILLEDNYIQKIDLKSVLSNDF